MLVPSGPIPNFVAIFLLFFVCIKSGNMVPNDVADKRYTKIWVLCFLFLFGLLSSFVRQYIVLSVLNQYLLEEASLS